jgi:hypothetical protein
MTDGEKPKDPPAEKGHLNKADSILMLTMPNDPFTKKVQRIRIKLNPKKSAHEIGKVVLDWNKPDKGP